jgi:hypothetical protein
MKGTILYVIEEETIPVETAAAMQLPVEKERPNRWIRGERSSKSGGHDGDDSNGDTMT